MNRPLPVILVLSLLLAPLPAQRKAREKPLPGTLACGSEVPWRPSLEAALADAQNLQRPVFWYVPTVAGSRMDRKPVIDLYMMAGPFAAEEVATLLARKFVPVKEVARGDTQQRYGLHHLRFIEPGFLVLTPDGTEILRIDKITTFSNEWFVWQLRVALRRQPQLARDSEEVAAARAQGDQVLLAEALLAEGEADGAREVLAGVREETAKVRYLRGLILVALRQEKEAEAALQSLVAAGGPEGTAARVELARLRLRGGSYQEAAEGFERASREKSPRQQEARFLHGVCLRLANRDEEAQKVWQNLARDRPESRWTRKATAESQRLGPFSRVFERFDWLPPDAFRENPDGTRLPRREDNAAELARRSVELLLRSQKADGSWDDSNYDFGGTESLPNVYVAGTALAALALLEWREVDPPGVDQAVSKALAYLLDERHLASEDRNEIVWAHAYRLIFLERLLRAAGKETSRLRTKALDIVKELLKSQLPSGGWRHEYPNPFATASVVHALGLIREAKVPIGSDVMARAASALKKCRGEDGTFSYGLGRRQAGSSPEFSAGRTPLCELALLMAGESDQEKLVAGIEAAFLHHQHLEDVRKYDDHADQFGNGGFFFWYAVYGRLEAIKAVEDAARREALKGRLRQLILELPEIDGGFVDSHELGKTYGTAMGLICLKGTEPARE